ncbi:membrane protein insertase YidC [Vagococcus sp. PNs007]|uniref:Membrane protein insertase YidC n=1 Tax=Vagococcus proximus TaxID=2991417 RepID=A0ABT5WYJ4_9ENTE|nr:membrane protein insertase YidC [Vagococcus proximus]MDF0478827.1 membrane protein insertase YidC [Vagococcus proximus]
MKKSLKKGLLASGLFGLVLTLSGCVQTYKSGPNIGKPTGDGWMYNLLVEPMSHLINYFVDIFSGNYGLAVIVFTLIVRAIILPLGLHQTKKASYQSEKMQYLKPQMSAIQAKQKAATTPQEQMAANQELQALYKDNNMSMFGGMGCLPLLIQMPIFTALFFTIKYMPGIESATFLGINLGKPNMILTVLAALSYLLQSYLSTIGMSEEQKKQMKMMLFMSPMMIGFISLSSPAGVTLYWVVGGIFSCIQTLISNLYQKPRIRKQIAEEFKKNPPKAVVTPTEKPKEVNKTYQTKSAKPRNAQLNNKQPKNGRNAGKQQRK